MQLTQADSCKFWLKIQSFCFIWMWFLKCDICLCVYVVVCWFGYRILGCFVWLSLNYILIAIHIFYFILFHSRILFFSFCVFDIYMWMVGFYIESLEFARRFDFYVVNLIIGFSFFENVSCIVVSIALFLLALDLICVVFRNLISLLNMISDTFVMN